MSQTKLVFINGRRQLVPLSTRPRQDSDRKYNRHRRGTKSDYLKFYHSVAWTQMRKQVLLRDYSTCQRCGLNATLVDHIIPSEDDWSDRLNPDNLQSLCTDCHYYKTRRETIKRKKGQTRSMHIHIIAGYPASGKTTYVRNHLGKHDLVYDYDALMSALTGLPMHEHNIDVSDYVQLIFEMIIRKLKSEKTFDNVWIIMTYPDAKLDSLLASQDVDHIRLSTSKDVCIQRLNQQHRNVSQLQSVFKKIDEMDVKGKFKAFKIISAEK